jgi:hypothetical protein
MTGTLFTLTFAVAAPFWALMIVLPRWSWTARTIKSPLIMAPVLVLTILLGPLGLAAYLGSGPGGWGRRSLLLPSRSA